jgi:hypothetical protein
MPTNVEEELVNIPDFAEENAVASPSRASAFSGGGGMGDALN